MNVPLLSETTNRLQIIWFWRIWISLLLGVENPNTHTRKYHTSTLNSYGRTDKTGRLCSAQIRFTLFNTITEQILFIYRLIFTFVMPIVTKLMQILRLFYWSIYCLKYFLISDEIFETCVILFKYPLMFFIKFDLNFYFFIDFVAFFCFSVKSITIYQFFSFQKN